MRFCEKFRSVEALSCLDTGINKPFDRIVKDFAAEAPMVFLRLLGIAPLGTLETLRAESAPHIVMPDYVSLLSIPGQDPCTFHVEFFLRYRSDVPGKMARYGGSLAWQYQRPVKSVLLLLKNDSVPDEVPAVGECVIGETRMSHAFRTVRLWELDPEPVLAFGDPGLLPWALLMRLNREEAERLGAVVGDSGNEQWIARFLTLGSLRYHRDELKQMLGGPRMGLVEAIMEGSSLVHYERQRAIAQGLAEGLAEGKVVGRVEGRVEGSESGKTIEAQRLLRLALRERFPGLESMPELEQITNLADLESLIVEHGLRSSDRQSAQKAILEAAAKHS